MQVSRALAAGAGRILSWLLIASVAILVVPVTLIRHYVRRLGIDYLAGQAYLERGPKELGAASLY